MTRPSVLQWYQTLLGFQHLPPLICDVLSSPLMTTNNMIVKVKVSSCGQGVIGHITSYKNFLQVCRIPENPRILKRSTRHHANLRWPCPNKREKNRNNPKHTACKFQNIPHNSLRCSVTSGLTSVPRLISYHHFFFSRLILIDKIKPPARYCVVPFVL